MLKGKLQLLTPLWCGCHLGCVERQGSEQVQALAFWHLKFISESLCFKRTLLDEAHGGMLLCNLTVSTLPGTGFNRSAVGVGTMRASSLLCSETAQPNKPGALLARWALGICDWDRGSCKREVWGARTPTYCPAYYVQPESPFLLAAWGSLWPGESSSAIGGRKRPEVLVLFLLLTGVANCLFCGFCCWVQPYWGPCRVLFAVFCSWLDWWWRRTRVNDIELLCFRCQWIVSGFSWQWSSMSIFHLCT